MYQSPCVVFTGHPSLRCGDSVHFMETWGSSAKNAVFFTGEAKEGKECGEGCVKGIVDALT